MNARGPIVIMLASLLAACAARAPEGKVYPRAAADVRAALLATARPVPLESTRLTAVQAREMPDGAIELALADEQGRPQLRFLAAVADLGNAKTRVAVAYAGADAALEKGMAAHPEIEAVYLKTVREQVDAELEGRPFNNFAIAPEVARAFASNAGAISQRMQAAGDAYRRQDRENIEKAYAEEARGERYARDQECRAGILRIPGLFSPDHEEVEPAMDVREDRRLHDAMDFIGLRALATAAGLIQMCTELRRAGVFDEAAVDRIKEAMAREIALSRRGTFEAEFNTAKQRLDAVFEGKEELRR